MSEAELIISLVAALAWPATVLVLGLVLRGPLTNLARSRDGQLVKRLKAGPVEVEWEQRLDEANRRLASAYSEGPPTSATDTLGDLLPIAESNPAAAVMLAYQRLETALSQHQASDDAPAAQTDPHRTSPPLATADPPSASDRTKPLQPQQSTPAWGSSDGVDPEETLDERHGIGPVPGGGSDNYDGEPHPVEPPTTQLPPGPGNSLRSQEGARYPGSEYSARLRGAIDELRELRNQIAHESPSESDLNPARAAQYVAVADGVAQALRRQQD